MSYKIAFLPHARKDFDEWKKTDGKTVAKIKEILTLFQIQHVNINVDGGVCT